jgi:gliding-associated putative ABC transporter substrate-binding component GldG
MLLEGSFTSAFKNRITPQDQNGQPLPFVEDGQPSQMFVMADGDVVRNQINLLNTSMPRGTPLPLGYDQYTGVTYGNKNFLLNVIDYMLDDSGLIDIRSRELTIRILDSQKIQGNTWKWALINTLIPLGVVGVAGLIWMTIRRKRYIA